MPAPPLLLAARGGCIDSVEWFLGPTPQRLYLEFATSPQAQKDPRIKHLAQAAGGVEGHIMRWLSSQSTSLFPHPPFFESTSRLTAYADELLLHAAILNSSNNRSTKLISSLLKSHPHLLEVRAANGMTPLLLAVYLHWEDAVKLLLSAGADPRARDCEDRNLLHLALDSIIFPDQLRALLDLIPKDVLAPMLKERDYLGRGGQTPLHCYLNRHRHTHGRTLHHDVLPIVHTLLHGINHDVVKQSLRMLDGAGETPLHTLLREHSEPALVRLLLELDPGLLYIENAVGLTPLEMLHNAWTNHQVVETRLASNTRCERGDKYDLYGEQNSTLSALFYLDPGEFVKPHEEKEEQACWANDSQSRTQKDGNEPVLRLWALCNYYHRHNSEENRKRVLVNLYQANLVMKRLESRYMAKRYPFASVFDDYSSDSYISGNDDDQPQHQETPGRKYVSDFVTQSYLYSLLDPSWRHVLHDDGKVPSEEEEKQLEEYVSSVCKKCGWRHWPDIRDLEEGETKQEEDVEMTGV